MLKKIGLQDYEARIFSVLASESPLSATSIAKRCALSRSSVYTTLSSLISKGLVGTTYKNEVKQFVAQGFDSLQALVKKERETLSEKETALKSIEKSFEEAAGAAADPLSSRSGLAGIPRIIFFEGQEGLKKIYKSMLWSAPKNSTMYILRDEFVWNKEWAFIFSPEWHASVKEIRTKKNIRTKLLINDSPAEKKQAKFYSTRKGFERRFLPKAHSLSDFAIYIINDDVSILSMERNNLVGIRMTNKNIARNFMAMFDAMWKK